VFTYAVVTWVRICTSTYIVREIYVCICCCYMGRNMYKYTYVEGDVCIHMLLLHGEEYVQVHML